MTDILGPGGEHIEPSTAGLEDIVKEGTAESFLEDVLEASKLRPVICDFGAPRSELSRTLSYDLEQLVIAAKGAIALVRFNVEQVPQIAQQLQIQSVPTVYAFVDGKPQDGFAGAATEEQLNNFVAKLTGDIQPAEAETLVADGLQALDTGDAERAAEVFGEALQSDRYNVDALAGLGRALLAMGDRKQAESVLAQVPKEHEDHAAVRSLKSALQLSEQTANVADDGATAALTQKVADNPADLDARFDLALAHVGNTENSEAIEQLLEIMRRKSGWNEDAARKQLLDLFSALGPTHELTIEGRRQLSTVLFS